METEHAVLNILDKIRTEIQDWSDEGEYRYIEDTATTTKTDLDIIKDFGFPVKGFVFRNDGNVTIEFGWMSQKHLLDVSDERMGKVNAGEELIITYRGKKIRRMIIKTSAGTSDYRLWLLW